MVKSMRVNEFTVDITDSTTHDRLKKISAEYIYNTMNDHWI